MQYTEIEQKLIRLALDSGAHDGEHATAATKLIQALRKRGVHADQVIRGNPSQESAAGDALLRFEVLAARGKIAALQREIEQLKAHAAAKTSHYVPKPPRPTRPKYGYQVLSRKERDLLFRFARRAGKDFEGTSLFGQEQPTDHQIMQRLMKKGYAEKRRGGQRGWHGLTEKGILYYKQYGQF